MLKYRTGVRAVVTPVRPRSPTVQNEPPPQWIDAAPGVRMRLLVEGAGTTIILYRIDPGTHFESHRHAFGELGVVLQGAGRMLVDGEERDLRAGESYYLPPECPHGLDVADGAEPMVLIDVSAFLPSDLPQPPVSQIRDLTAQVVRRKRRTTER